MNTRNTFRIPALMIISMILHPLLNYAQIGPVEWSDTANVTIDTTAGCLIRNGNGWNGGGSAIEGIRAGEDGYFEFTVSANSAKSVFGVSQFNVDHNWKTVEYGFYFRSPAVYKVSESGRSKSGSIAYQAGDLFRIERIGGILYYSHNGQVIRGTIVDPWTYLFLDVSIATDQAQICDVSLWYDTSATGLGDNLGNHCADMNIKLNNNWLSGDGDNEGISVGGTGNVGIGKQGATVPLDILNTSGGFASKITSPTGDEGMQIYSNSVDAGTKVFQATSNKVGLTVFADGNVGVGTIAPTAKLEVAGGMKLQSGTRVNEFSIDGALTGNSDDAVPTEKAIKTYVDDAIANVQNQGGDTDWTFQGQNIYNNTGNVGIGTTSPNHPLQVSASNADYAVEITQGVAGQGLSCYVNTSDAAKRVMSFVSNFGGVHFFGNGKMGVNTVTPDNDLSVDGDMDVSGDLGIGTVNPTSKLHVSDGSVMFSGNIGAVPVSGSGTRMMWVPSKKAFRAGGVAGIHWDEARIGDYSAATGYSTTASGYASHAAGTFAKASGDRSFAYGAYIEASANDALVIGSGASILNQMVNSTANSIMLGANSTVPTLFIEGGDGSAGSYGNVGVGTTSPSNTLSVAGGADFADNVGIGTTNPGARLDILQAANTQFSGIRVSALSGAFNALSIWVDDADGGKAYIHKTGVADQIVLLNDGRIGMGTDDVADGYMLSVDGKVICEELKVQFSGSWPDYVFADDYNLMSLEQLEATIENQKHLPGVPSAKVIEAEGVSTGEMHAALLEKIEELTLYVIQLNKENKAIRAELNTNNR